MSTTLKVVVGLLLVVAGFGVYLVLQPPPPPSQRHLAPLPSPRPIDATGGVMGLGPGLRPWAVQYNDRGELQYRFSAESYTPADAANVRVVAPVVEFFLSDGQVVRLSGRAGTVTIPRREGAPESPFRIASGQAPAAPPSRGTMSDVVISVFPPGASPDSPTLLTASVPGIAFDVDTLRISTEDVTDAAGNAVPWDQVPVTIRGREIEFDGQGLAIRLNERDQTIQSLDIARGTRLLIKDPDLIPTPPSPPGAVTGAPATPTGSPDMPPGVSPVAADAASAGQAGLAAAGSRPPIVYRAVLSGNLVISQAGQTLATADFLQIDFRQATPVPTAATRGQWQGGAASPPNPPPGSPPGPHLGSPPVAPATPDLPASDPGRLPPGSSGGGFPLDPAQPIVLHWSGPVRITPTGDPHTPPGHAIVLLTGQPGPAGPPGRAAVPQGGAAVPPGGYAVPPGGSVVQLTQGRSTARAPAVLFETATQLATLQGDTAQPVTLTDGTGAIVTTPLLKYDLPRRQARLTGVSLIRIPVADGPEPGLLLASFSSRATLQFVPAPGDADAARMGSASLEGDVAVDHPRLRLRADALDLTFAPLATPQAQGQHPPGGYVPPPVPGRPPGGLAEGLADAAELQSLSARGDVAAVLLDPQAPASAQPAAIRAQTLLLTTAPDARTGRLVPSRLLAETDVHASDGRQSLAADRLELDLVPDPASPPTGVPTPLVQSIHARGGVRATAADGSLAAGSILTVHDASGSPTVTLEGPGASLSGEEATITAERIEYRQADGIARLTGPGIVAAAAAADPGDHAAPFTARYSELAIFDDVAGRITVTGAIQVETVGADGAVSVATGDQLVVSLGPPAAAPGDAAPPETERLLARRAFQGLTLSGNVMLESVLGDAQGNLLRQVTLLSDSVTYAADGAFSVPGPGRLLFVDRRLAPEQRPDRVRDTLPTGRGSTAVRWADRLSYAPATRRLDFVGQVAFVHQPLDPREAQAGGVPAEEPFRLFADSVSAFLAAEVPAHAAGVPAHAAGVPAHAAGSEAPGQPRAPERPPPDPRTAQLERVLAEGDFSFSGRGLQARGHRLEFLPATQVLTASGQPRLPVEISDPGGAGVGTADLIRLNLRTGHVEQLVRPTGSLALTPPPR